MTKAKNTKYAASSRERGLLVVSAVIMIGTIPFTYVFFLLPLLNLTITLLAVLVATRVIHNKVAVKVIEVLAVLGTLSALWITGIPLSYFGS